MENSGLDGDSCLDEAVAQDPDEPTRLNELVLEAVAQHDDCFRASIGRTACRDLWCQATARARTGGGRTSLLTEQYNTPPVYLRPSGPQPIAPHDETDRTAELMGRTLRQLTCLLLLLTVMISATAPSWLISWTLSLACPSRTGAGIG